MKIFSVLKKTAINWYKNDPFSHAAAISYYTIFSFPALVFIYLALASIFSSEADLHNHINSFMNNIAGPEGAQNMEKIIQNTAPKNESFWPLAIGSGILLFAALKLFMQLQKAFNIIWHVKVPDHVKVSSLVKQRVLVLSIMLGVGFIMVSSLVITSSLSALGHYLAHHISPQLIPVMHLINFVISLFVLSALFTVLLKLLPDIKIPWRPAIIGGATTALMFIIGEYAIGLYFQLAKPGSSYGATASIVLLMLWVSYTCVILLFGAELTKTVLEDVHDKEAQPNHIAIKKHAVKK